MRCNEIMKGNVECLQEHHSAAMAAGKMLAAGVGFLPVCDEMGRVIGTLTDRDIALRVCAEDRLPSTVAVVDIMTSEIVACGPEDPVARAQSLMATHQKSRIMVTDEDGRIVGVISLSDIAQHADPAKVGRTMRAVSEREARPY